MHVGLTAALRGKRRHLCTIRSSLRLSSLGAMRILGPSRLKGPAQFGRACRVNWRVNRFTLLIASPRPGVKDQSLAAVQRSACLHGIMKRRWTNCPSCRSCRSGHPAFTTWPWPWPGREKEHLHVELSVVPPLARFMETNLLPLVFELRCSLGWPAPTRSNRHTCRNDRGSLRARPSLKEPQRSLTRPVRREQTRAKNEPASHEGASSNRTPR